jgi:hypothetical protein
MFSDDKILFNNDEVKLIEKSREYEDICVKDNKFLVLGAIEKNIWYYSIMGNVPVYGNVNGNVKNLYIYNVTSFNYWKNRVEYDCLIYYYEDEDVVITNVILTDRLSNDGVVKLIDRLYSLPGTDYEVKNYYRKSNMLRTYDYVKLQYSRSSVGRFAEIEFLNDKYIDRLEISWTQVNSVYAFIEYIFWFKKCLDESKRLI